MQLTQLEALLAVLEEGSFLAAARSLGRRRATLQAQVEALETELGHELLVRSPRGTHPTRAGEALADRARILLAEAHAVRHFLDEGPPTQQLRMAAEPGLPPHLFLLMNQVLSARIPDTQLEFEVCSPDEAIANPRIDLIVQLRDALPTGSHRTFVAQRYPVRLLASPAYLDARGRPESIEDLDDHDLIAWTGYRPERRSLWPRPDGAPFAVRPTTVTNDTHVARFLANAGQGIALVADAPQAEGIMEGEDLERVLDGVVGEEARGRILIPERSARAPAVRAFVQLAREFGLQQHEMPEP